MIKSYQHGQDFSIWLTNNLRAIRQYLQMETGIASLIEGDMYQIAAVDSELEGAFTAAMEFSLEATYCHAVCTSKSPISYGHIGQMDAMLNHPVYLAVRLESYIAVPILDRAGSVAGTVNFTSLVPREQGFTEPDFRPLLEFSEHIREHLDLYKQVLQPSRP